MPAPFISFKKFQHPYGAPFLSFNKIESVFKKITHPFFGLRKTHSFTGGGGVVKCAPPPSEILRTPLPHAVLGGGRKSQRGALGREGGGARPLPPPPYRPLSATCFSG